MKSTVVPKSTTSILGWFIVYSGIPQTQGTSSWLWGFNLLLLRLHREISLSLLCSHSSWGSALVLALPLSVGCPQASVPLPDRRGLKQQLIRALLLTQAGMGRGTVVITGMWGEPAAAEASVTLQQPEACCVFSQESCPWIMGPWQWWAAQAPMGCMDSDLCLHTGFLVAAAAAVLAFHAHLWGPTR